MAQEMLNGVTAYMARFPTGFAHWLNAAAFTMGDPREVAVVGLVQDADTKELLAVLNQGFRPNLVVAAGESAEGVPLLAERPQVDGKATAYVCRRFVCKRPVTDAQSLLDQLD
jgi:hypothetical protein